jgi:hypothetical protein
MKKQVTPAILITVLSIAGIGLVAYILAVVQPSFGPGPKVEPRPFSPPPGYKMPNSGGPIGAPNQSAENSGKTTS